MQIRAILPALALLAGFLRAQQPAAKPGSIEGNVANAVTGEPVKKAVVTLQNLGPQPNQTRVVNKTALTDAAGHFRFDAVEPGSYQVAADRDGFKPSFQARGARVPVPVAEDQHVEDVSLRMLPLATVEGHVFDDDGDPLIRANVAPLQYSYDQGRKQLTTAGFANTNDRGEFQIANLPPGRYYFAVTVRGPALNLPPRTRWARPEERLIIRTRRRPGRPWRWILPRAPGSATSTFGCAKRSRIICAGKWLGYRRVPWAGIFDWQARLAADLAAKALPCRKTGASIKEESSAAHMI